MGNKYSVRLLGVVEVTFHASSPAYFSSPLLRNLQLTVCLRNSLANFQLKLPLLQAFCFIGGIIDTLAGNTCTDSEREAFDEDWN